jgi:hypothetical protein
MQSELMNTFQERVINKKLCDIDKTRQFIFVILGDSGITKLRLN